MGGGEIESYVQDFMVIKHDPLEEEMNLQRQTERLLDRWHGLVLKGRRTSNADNIDSVEARIQRNIHRHEKMLVWLGSMERDLQHEAVAYEDACAMASSDHPSRFPTATVVDESERILKQIDALLMDRQEWELSASLSSLDMSATPAAMQSPLFMA
ncbi:hypothetical protein DYB28_002020 [Aphanomyces astaci]|uniref:Uncharacterized protein n=2 Tax=Aphanomyces astaci TaxID=112090 RepID=A0A397BGA7_APHAT|nr:hypothetical protein DYB36_010889 [Aphanomyces astaci]RHY23761.1 hypothetical protein DYB25_006581 [Aphanomyces astaci]RLO06531.1 hypothetical protein DYB28_002020 [Aphanomyces astaci]